MTPQELYQKLKENRCRPSVIERVMKLNPNGYRAGDRLRGMRRDNNRWVDDSVGPKQFIAKHGVYAYRNMDQRWWKQRGHRRDMSRLDYLDNVWKFEWTGVPGQYNHMRRILL